MTFSKFKWARYGSDDYLYAIDHINDIYRKMLAIGEAKKVFRDKACPLMTAKSKKEFQCERTKLQRKYLEYTKLYRSRPTLPNFNLDVEFVPEP